MRKQERKMGDEDKRREVKFGDTVIPYQNHFGKRLRVLPMSLRRAAISSANELRGSEKSGRPLYFRSRWSTIGL